MFNRLDKWHKTRSGYLVFAVVELAAAYAVVSIAFNDGQWWLYLVFLVLLVGGLKNLLLLLKTFLSSKRRTRR